MDGLNIGHSSEKAKEIALGQLKAYLVAMGYPNEFVFQQNEALIGREVMVLVGVEPEQERYPAKNKVLKVRSTNATQQPATIPTPVPQQPMYPPQQAPMYPPVQSGHIPYSLKVS